MVLVHAGGHSDSMMGLTTKPPDADHKPPGVRIERPVLESESAPNMATIQDDDELLLARIGYKQVCTPEWQ